MELNLEQAFEEPVDLSHRFDVPVERLGRPELVSLEPVEFTGRLQKADPGFVLTGELLIAGAVTCARCLGDVPFGRRQEVSWVFSPAHVRPASEDLELGEEDLEVVWYDELSVPFDPLIDELVQLELPMKPLCREDCRGLCPACGADRNSSACTCAEPGDDRWQALKSLLPPR